MKKFNVSLNIQREIECESEEEAQALFLEGLEEETNLPLSVVINDNTKVKEIKK